jgi:hypothetical protein
MEVNFKRIQEIADRVTIGRTGYSLSSTPTGVIYYSPANKEIGHLSDLDQLPIGFHSKIAALTKYQQEINRFIPSASHPI